MSSGIGGGAEHVFLLAKGLCQRGHRVAAVIPNDGPYFARLGNLGIKVVDLPIRSFSWRTLAGIRKVVRNEQSELIHSHGLAAGIYSRVVGKLTTVPVIHTMHGLHYRRYSLVARRILLGVERILDRMTSLTIHVSETQRREALKLGLGEAHRCCVIRNGIDVARFDNPDRHSSPRGVVSTEGTVIVNVSRFSTEKGQGNLIRALAGIHLFGLQCLLIGDGKTRSMCEALASRLGLENVVRFLGWREDIPDLLRGAGIYVSSSLWEGMPLAILEAMASRLPVIATDVVGNRDAVVPDVTGVLVPPSAPDRLGHAIRELSQMKWKRIQLGEAGRERVEKMFHWERMVNETEAAYERTLGNWLKR